MPGAEIGILSSGSNDPAIVEASDMLLENGIKTDYLRIRSLPFSNEVEEFIGRHKMVYIVENNRDGQLLQLLTIRFPAQAERMCKAAHMDGLPLTAKWVFEQINPVKGD